MNARDWLIELCTKKQNLLNLFGDFNYFTEADKKDIESWAEDKCKEIRKHIHFRSRSLFKDFCCPWCDKNFACQNCTYGFRHGRCSYIQSDYDKIDKYIKLQLLTVKPITNFPEYQAIMAWIKAPL